MIAAQAVDKIVVFFFGCNALPPNRGPQHTSGIPATLAEILHCTPYKRLFARCLRIALS
jgi:hypothetical protein